MWFHSCYIHTLLSFNPSNLTFSYLFPLPTPFSSFLPPSFLQIFFVFTPSFLPPLSLLPISLFSSYLNLTLHLPSTSSLFFLPIFSLPSLFSHHSILPSYSSPPSLLLLSPLSPTFSPFSLPSVLSLSTLPSYSSPPFSPSLPFLPLSLPFAYSLLTCFIFWLHAFSMFSSFFSSFPASTSFHPSCHFSLASSSLFAYFHLLPCLSCSFTSSLVFLPPVMQSHYSKLSVDLFKKVMYIEFYSIQKTKTK